MSREKLWLIGDPGDPERSDPTPRKVEARSEIRDTSLEHVERARAELGLREATLREGEHERAALRQRLADSERDNRRLQRELGQLIDRVFEQDDLLSGDDPTTELRREVAALRGKNAVLRRRLVDAGLDPADDARPSDDAAPPVSQALSDELGRAVGDRDDARAEVAALEEQLRRAWAEMETVARDLDLAREDTHELQDLRREHRALQVQRDDMQQLIDELRARVRELREDVGADAYEREMAVARELLDGLEKQCERAESRAAGYKTELVELRAVNAELRKHLSALGRRVTAGWGAGRRDLSKR